MNMFLFMLFLVIIPLRFVVCITILTLSTTQAQNLTNSPSKHPLLRKIGIKNNYLPMDLFQRLWGFCMCSIMGIQVNVRHHSPNQFTSALSWPFLQVEGMENVSTFASDSIPSIGAFQHSSQIDLFAVIAKSPIVYKWVGKRSVFYIPFVGQMGRLLGMVPIDRGDHGQAIKSIQNAAKQVHKWRRYAQCYFPFSIE